MWKRTNMQPAEGPLRPKLYASEVGHLGAIDALAFQRSAAKCPSGPAADLPPRSGSNTKLGHRPVFQASQRLPAPRLRPNVLGDHHQQQQNVATGKNLSIRIPEAANTMPSKCMSTKHADAPASMLTEQTKSPPLMAGSSVVIPNHEPAKCSVKKSGVVRAYAANTNQGLVRYPPIPMTRSNRNYNEDRVSIILNILKPPSRGDENWPKCSFFGVYDGHGGAACADYLRDNLHQFVIREPSFPWNPREALRRGFESAEKRFLELAHNGAGVTERSGSCAVVTLIVGDMCYIANVGDSRAVLSGYDHTSICREGGSRVYALTRDHKPCDELERKRIMEAGGQIYQATAPAPLVKLGTAQQEMLVGPHRVLPGRLSVCRTFGDAEAKLGQYGGNPNVVIATPEIKSFKIMDTHDFVVMCSDGIFDKLSNKDVVQCVWNGVRDERASKVHQQCGVGVDTILKNALFRRSLDNVTSLIIGFSHLKKMMQCATQPIHRSPGRQYGGKTGNEENEQRNINLPERHHEAPGAKKPGLGAAKRSVPRVDPTVMSKIVASSTRALSQKHFDFGRSELLGHYGMQ